MANCDLYVMRFKVGRFVDILAFHFSQKLFLQIVLAVLIEILKNNLNSKLVNINCNNIEFSEVLLEMLYYEDKI